VRSARAITGIGVGMFLCLKCRESDGPACDRSLREWLHSLSLLNAE
jgi:hypothetical protein